MESLGRKVAMLTAGIFYGLGTILCASSGSMYQLIAARAVAGVSPCPIPGLSVSKLISAWRRRTIDGFFGDRH
jgi:MFS family permease